MDKTTSNTVRKKSTVFSKEWFHDNSTMIAGYAGLVVCILLFGILSPIVKDVNIFSGATFKGIFIEGATYAILSCGAVFVYALGAMDISVGAQMSLSAVLLIRIYNVAGSNVGAMLLGFLVIIVIALICGAINSVLAAVLKIKPIITSLFLQFVLYGVSYLLFYRWVGESESITFDAGTASKTAFAPFRDTYIVLITLVIVVLVMTYLFNFTKIGKYCKAIGANQNCAAQAGINVPIYRMVAYLIFGVALVIGTIIFLANKSAITYEACKGYEMDIIICLILGGMPISGGMKSRISAAVVGSFTYALIDICFVYIGVSANLTNLFVAIIYIVVVLITCRDRGRVLPQ